MKTHIRNRHRSLSVLALLLLVTLAPDVFAQMAAARGFEDRHDRVVREVERTQELWDEVSSRVEQTSAANLRALVEQAARIQGQARQALSAAEGAVQQDSGRADEHLRNSLALTLRARDMTTRAARQLREELTQEESARRMLDRVRGQYERLRQDESARRSPLWDQATQLVEQARLQWREGNFEQALRLAQNAANVLDMLEQRSGGAGDRDRVGIELQRTEDFLQRARERAGDRPMPALDQAAQLLREARQALAEERVELAAERIRAARRLIGGAEERGGEGTRDQIDRALARLDAQIERFHDRVGPDAPQNVQRLLRQAIDERDRGRRAVQSGNEAQARQHVRAAADLLARLQRQLGGRG